MREADGRAGLVDMLAAGTARAIRVLADIVGEIDFNHRLVVDGGRHVDGREGGVPAACRVERADANQSMVARFSFEMTEHVIAAYGQSRVADARLFGRRRFQELAL